MIHNECQACVASQVDHLATTVKMGMEQRPVFREGGQVGPRKPQSFGSKPGMITRGRLAIG